MAFLCNSSNFLHLLHLLCCIPFVYSLSTIAISETSNRTVVCALTKPAYHQAFHLNCTSFSQGFQIPVNPNASFVGVVAGNGFVCALTAPSSSSISVMVCWRFSANGDEVTYKRLYQGPPLKELDAGNSRICGVVNGTSRLECWQWRGFNEDHYFSSIAVGENFACGLSESGKVTCFGSNSTGVVGTEPRRNCSVVAAGFRHACAISSDDKSLNCWGDMAGEKPTGEFESLALGENRSCALRSDQKVVCWGESNFSLPERLQGTYFTAIKAKRSIFCGVSSSNYSLYCWGNGVFDSNSMVFQEVFPGPCRSPSQCPCGPVIYSSIICGPDSILCDPCRSKTPPSTPPSPSPAPSPGAAEKDEPKSNGWNEKMVAFLVVGCVGSSALVLVCCFFLYRYYKYKGCSRVHDSGRLDEPGTAAGNDPLAEQPAARTVPVLEKRLSHVISFGNGGGPLEEFSLQVLLDATNGFSEDHKIGSGSFGSVYHAKLDDGREVAVKRAEASISNPHAVRREEDKDTAFVSELESLWRLNHKNLVRLLGFSEDSNERVLVYEFMQNGTLHDHLHKLPTLPLRSWPARLKVALDAARGIEYLHVYAVPPIIHRDIKSSNILLDNNWTAKVSDFGLSLMGPPDDDSHLSLRAAGTVGYIDPEYYRLQQLTTKSDVYSFGVVLLEMLSGYRAIHRNEGGVPRNVIDIVVPFIVQDEIHRVLDRNMPPPTPFEIEAVAYVGYLAVDCVTLEGRDRPSMTDIVSCLERALDACLARPTLSRSTDSTS